MAETVGVGFSILTKILEGFNSDMGKRAAKHEFGGKKLIFHLNNGEIVRGVFLGYSRGELVVQKSHKKIRLPYHALSMIEEPRPE